jgi:hypothetical protein
MKKSEADVSAPTETSEDSLTQSGLMAEFMPEVNEATEEEAPEAEAPVEDQLKTTLEVPEEESSDEEESEPSILGRLAPEGLSEEEKTALSVELGSGSGQRIGKLTSEKKALAAQLETALSKLTERPEPLEVKDTGDNPFADKTTVEQLEEINQAATETVELWGDLLDDNRDAVSDDEIGMVGDEAITKHQARQMVRNAKAAIRKHLPARLKELREGENYERTREANLEAVHGIHPWMQEDGSEMRAAYDAASKELVEDVRKHMPHRLHQIDLMLADHCKASFLRQEGQSDPTPATKKAARRRAPGTPGGAGGAASRPASGKARADRDTQFLDSAGSQADLATYFM